MGDYDKKVSNYNNARQQEEEERKVYNQKVRRELELQPPNPLPKKTIDLPQLNTKRELNQSFLSKLVPDSIENDFNKWKSQQIEAPNKFLDLTQNIGYIAEQPLKIPFINRLVTTASKTLGGEKSIAEDAPINKYSADTGSKVLNTVASMGGNLIGLANTPVGGNKNLLNVTDDIAAKAGQKIASKIGQETIAKRILPEVVRGAVDGGLGNTVDALRFDKTPQEIAQDTLMGAIGGGALFGVNKAIGDVVGNAKLKFNKGLEDLGNTLDDVVPKAQPKPIEPILKPKTINMPIEGLNSTLKTNIEMPLQDATARSKIPEYEGGSGQFKTSELKTNTMRKSPFLQTEEAQKVIDDIKAQYEVKPNVQTINRATTELENNFDEVVNRIRENGIQTAEDATASGLISKQLRVQAEQTGDYTQLKGWLETVQPHVTNVAQSLQALSTWKKLTPDGALMKAQQVVDKVNRDGLEQFGKNFKKVELTNDEMKFITDTMTKIDGMPDGRAKDIEFAKVKQVIAEKIPSTFTDKLNSWRRIAMLLNPKTMTRNVLGNVIMGGLEEIKDIPSSIIDIGLSKGFGEVGQKVASKFPNAPNLVKTILTGTGERTTLAPTLEGFKTKASGFKKGVLETLEDAKLGVDTSPTRGQFEIPQAQSFRKGKILPKLEKATNVGLQMGDRPFYQAYYDDYIRQQMKLNKTSDITEEMMNKAKEYAEDKTFQNVSKLAKSFQGLRKVLNLDGKIGLGDVVLPFTKTPANILDKAVDYSPIGGFKGIINLANGLKKGALDQKKVVDQLGRSLTGSALIMAGYELASQGVLTGKSDKDKDVAALERQTGKSDYAFKVGDTYRTFSWAQPAAIPLAMGADIYYQTKDKKAAENFIIEAAKSGGKTLFDQSLLQGVNKLFAGSNPAESIAEAFQNYPQQFLPTLGKQINQLGDPLSRGTYSDKWSEKQLNEAKSKIPGLSSALEPRIDTLGREVKNFQGKNNLYNVFLNPGYTTKENASLAEKLALDIYRSTGDKIQFPRVAKDSITYKTGKDASEKINLTAQERNDLQKYIGQETEKQYTKLYNNQYFMKKNPKEQAKELQSLLTEIYNKGEENILKNRGIKEYKGK